MRNIFRVESKLQRRYMRIIELSLLLPTLVVVACLYYLVFSLVAEEIAIPEFIALILFPALKRINIILLIGLPIIFFILFGLGMVLSHRLAGPIDRLNKELGHIVRRKDYNKRLKVRKEDELKGIVNNVNILLDKIEGKEDL